MLSILDKIKKFPTSPGVYIFRDKSGEILYVGKATSLRDRAGSYFQKNLRYERPIEFVMDLVVDVEIKQTDTVLEAYFLEQDLIKRLQPKYNVLGKDDKSFVYVLVTREDFPRFEVKRKTDLEAEGLITDSVGNTYMRSLQGALRKKYAKIYGPYTARYMIEEALRILRKIFPYHSKPQQTEKGCMDYQIGLCPGPYLGEISKEDYKRNIQGIEMILKGHKKSLIRRLEKQMHEYSRKEEFEKAAQLRNQVFSLRHIQDIAMIRESSGKIFSTDLIMGRKTPLGPLYKGGKSQDNHNPPPSQRGIQGVFRIEGYDISNISGKHATGSMVVFDSSDGDLKANKDQYRKFRIRTIEQANDVGSMEEVLRRRLKNSWKLPNLILLDGGKGHLNMARRVLRDYHLEIPLLAVAKGPSRKKLDFYSYGRIPRVSRQIIAQVRDEAHRFAITYHRKLREIRF